MRASMKRTAAQVFIAFAGIIVGALVIAPLALCNHLPATKYGERILREKTRRQMKHLMQTGYVR